VGATVKSRASRAAAAIAIALAIAASVHWWLQHDRQSYLPGITADFVAIFPPPPSADSAATRAELDELLALQSKRTDAEVNAARRDRKTEVERFYGALGFAPGTEPDLPLLHGLAERVEDDIRPYVRAAKNRFRRLRPYEIEERLEPCIVDVRGDLSYPSGHANYGYVMAYLLKELVPERATELTARADEFARQRMVCGVHFKSDLEAGRRGAEWLVRALLASEAYRVAAQSARTELRTALKLPDT